MKKAAIIWNIIVITLSILFACGVISSIGWLIGSLATTLFCNIVYSEEEGKARRNKEFFSEKELEEAELTPKSQKKEE